MSARRYALSLVIGLVASPLGSRAATADDAPAAPSDPAAPAGAATEPAEPSEPAEAAEPSEDPAPGGATELGAEDDTAGDTDAAGDGNDDAPPWRLRTGESASSGDGPSVGPFGGQVDYNAGQKGRPRKPFEPDTQLKLTGDDLAQQGAQTLAEAIDLLPEATIRTSGRGQIIADVRGGRKGAIKVIVDGVPIDDPYYGNFDLSSIPVTDIVELRVSTAPASPLDGPGGSAGVIEVITVRARGSRRVAARAQASSAPDASGWVTARAPLGGGLGMRASAGGTFGGRSFDVTMPTGQNVSLGEDTRAGSATFALERSTPTLSYGLGLWAQHRSYVVPPGEDAGADVLVVDGENMGRLSLWGELFPGRFRVLARGYVHLQTRDSRTFTDASMDDLQTREAVDANRSGISLWANRAIGPGLELVLAAGVDSDAADVASGDGMVHQGGRTTIGNGAVGLQLRRGAWKLDAAVGGAAPTGASPWPEAKLTVTWAPRPELALSLVGAQKGRVPTLRERYALGIGNEALDPELARFGEAKLSVRGGGASLSGAGYVRAVDGMIRLNDARTELVNIGAVTLMGVDVDGKYTPAHLSWLTVGASWHFIDADGEMSGEPVDFLPAHKLDGSLRLTWKQHGGLSARVRWVDERLDNGVTLPSYTTADVSAFYDVRTDLRATMRIDNLADERYLARQNGYHDPGRLVLIGLEGVWE